MPVPQSGNLHGAMQSSGALSGGITYLQGPVGPIGPTGNGIQSTTLNPDYTLTIQYTNGSTYTTEPIRGATGTMETTGDTLFFIDENGALCYMYHQDEGESGYVYVGALTAYGLAVKNGFVGTEAEWLASLVGPATIAIGSVTTGEPGTNAAVTNSGTSESMVLDFTIPRGATGATGATGEVSENDLATLRQATANALRKMLSGTAIRADDVSPLAHNLSGITQYGQCLQAGTPTPTSPIPITGKAAGASVYTKNLLRYDNMRQSLFTGGATVTQTEDGIIVNGTLASSFNSYFFLNTPLILFPNVTYYFSLKISEADKISSKRLLLYDNPQFTGEVTPFDADTSYTPTVMMYVKAIYLWGRRGATLNNCFIGDFQVEVGATATAYEPYIAPITQTVTDANGNAVTLYGVPVTSGGNVTIGAQQYVADTLSGDTATRRVGHIPSYNGEAITTAYISDTDELSTGADVYYVLDTPTTETVTVSPTALPANSPTTTWTSDAYSNVTYNRDINKAFEELAAAIVALGGTI